LAPWSSAAWFAVGYNSAPDIVFVEDVGTVQRLCEEREPARVYLNDPNSWVYRAPGVTEEERAKLKALATELLLPFSVKGKLLGFISLSITISTISHSSNTHSCIATHQP
jgi:hypothetical protein